jgi:nucleoporin POM152
MYNIARNDEAGGTTVLDQPTFSSIQPHTRFQLHTSTIGRKYYEVKQIGDSAYPLAKHKNSVIPRSDRLVFEQEVMPRPSAQFKNDNRMSFCLNDALTSREALSNDGNVIQLDGTPPFQLALSVRNLAASHVHRETVEVQEKMWRLHLPSYHFTSIGPHQITIESVQDSSRCEQIELSPLHRSIWVDVAESAAIVPFDKRVDFCVGDMTQFQLEGKPPWSIGCVGLCVISWFSNENNTIDTGSTASHTHKKQRRRRFPSYNNRRGNSRLPQSRSSRSFARLQSLTFDLLCILYQLPKSVTASGYTRTFMKVRAV